MADDNSGFVGSIPDYYDRDMGPIIFADYGKKAAARVAALKPTRILETAAGSGIVTRALRDALPAQAFVTATDLNAAMLEAAKTKFRPDEHVAFQTADAMNLPFEDGSFDVVLCQFGVMFYPDKDRSYREARRVLTPGGRYLLSVWDSIERARFGFAFVEACRRVFVGEPPPFPSAPFSYSAIDPIKDALTRAGFRDIHIDVLPMEIRVPDCRAFARGMVRGSPVIDQLQSRGVDPERLIDEACDRLVEETRATGRIAMQAIFFEAARD
jgi:SAM-dependent methyltransferase